MAFAAAGHRVRDDLRGPALTRLGYLDWLRGLAVLLMIEAHTVDAWTREADRNRDGYWNSVFVAGLAAPLFLFLAGVALVLAASSRVARGSTPSEAAAMARYRGWQVLALGLLFRVQSQVLGWGAWHNLLRVDILNIMGLAMVVAGALWGLAHTRRARLLFFAASATAVTMFTPVVRQWDLLAPLPDPLEAYLRPTGPYSAFTLFPWAGFLLAGAFAGECIDATRRAVTSWRLQAGFAVAGVSGVLIGWWASTQPTIYEQSNFWTSSPTFFFIRLGIATALLPIAWMAVRAWGTGAGPIETIGRSSLFVYWVHLELVYGGLGRVLERRLPLEGAFVAMALLAAFMYWLTLKKNAWMEGRTLRGPWRVFEPVLR